MQPVEVPRHGQLNNPADDSARPLVSMEGFARFEQRARQRRIERRLDAARTALRNRRFADAHAALDELREIDPSLPDLAPLTAALLQAEHARRSHPAFGALAAAAAAFAVIAFGASWTSNTGLLQSYPFLPVSALAPAAAAQLSITLASDVALPTSGELDLLDQDVALTPAVSVASPPETMRSIPEPSAFRPEPPATRPEPPSIPEPALAASIAVVPPAPIDVARGVTAEPLSAPALAAPPRPSPPMPAPNAVAPAVNAIETAGTEEEDMRQVLNALQRYRAAYDRLDADQARAVWPAVNQAALARAFDGLESQSLTFDACDVQLRGTTASAVCRGTTRYVPKVGSHEPRVESLVWNFTLRKTAAAWQIQTARADR